MRFSSKVKNVDVCAYYHFIGPGPVEEPVIKGATGTFTDGIFLNMTFSNLDLNYDGDPNAVTVHQMYYAIGEYENGDSFTTPNMYCLQAGETPVFGISHTYELPDGGSMGVSVPPYITLSPLTEIYVSQTFGKDIPLSLPLIKNGTGNVIATKLGTPHEMGIEVDKGTRVNPLVVGMTNILATGKTENGELYSIGNLTCVSAGEPAVFIQEFQP